jgi:hypothetical protein
MYYSTIVAVDEADDADLQRGHFSQVKSIGIYRIFGRSQEWALIRTRHVLRCIDWLGLLQLFEHTGFA